MMHNDGNPSCLEYETLHIRKGKSNSTNILLSIRLILFAKMHKQTVYCSALQF